MAHSGLRLLALLALYSCLAAPAVSKQARSPLRDQVFHIVERVAVELHPGSTPRMFGSPRGRAAFVLEGVGEEGGRAPRLYIQGGANGFFQNPRVVVGVSGEYRIPQLLTGLAYLDPRTGSVKCGYAVLEPTATALQVRFDGLRRLDLGSDEAHAFLCGVILSAEDRYGGVAEGEGDGIHEVLVRVYAVDRRKGADPPPVMEETYLLELASSGPSVLERVSSEVSETKQEHLPLYLEYSGIDEVRIVGNFEYGNESPPGLPPELAEIQEHVSGAVIHRVTHEGGLTTLVGSVGGAGGLNSLVDELRAAGYRTRKIEAFVVASQPTTGFRVTYGPADDVPSGTENAEGR